MTEQDPGDTPDPGSLADPEDDLGWDRAVHGLFEDYHTRDDAVRTIAYDPEEAPDADATRSP